MKRLTVFVTLVVFSFSFFGNVSFAAEEPKVDWGEEFIKARGLGSFRGAPSSRRLIIAREKAKMRAERDLLGIIHELKIDSQTTLKETMESDDYSEVIKRQIKGTLRGAKILAEGQLNRNTYEVIVGVKFSDVRKAALFKEESRDEEESPTIIPSRNFMNLGNPGVTNLQYMKKEEKEESKASAAVAEETASGKIDTVITEEAPSMMDQKREVTSSKELSEDELNAALVGALPGQEIDRDVEPAPAPTEDWQPPQGHSDVAASSAYTSLIVDARGLDADRAFWPRVLGPEKEVIYGNYDASVDFLQDQGAVAYCSSLEEAKECNRAKGNPLVVEAKDVYGRYKADLVLSAKDSAKVKTAEQEDGFLKAYRVIFVMK